MISRVGDAERREGAFPACSLELMDASGHAADFLERPVVSHSLLILSCYPVLFRTSLHVPEDRMRRHKIGGEAAAHDLASVVDRRNIAGREAGNGRKDRHLSVLPQESAV